MNDSNPTSYCQIAQSILGARGFSYLLSLEIVVGLLAAATNAPLMILVWRVSVFHYNLRILLSFLSFSLLWYSVGYGIKAAALLHAIVTRTNPCDFTMNAFDCKCQEIPFTIPIAMTVYSLLFVNLERLYSTMFYRNYDRGSIFPWFGCLLVLVAVASSAAQIVSVTLKMPKDRLVGLCENLLSMTVSNATTTFCISSTLLTAGLICCVAGYLWNKYRSKQAAINRAQHTLASRFQIDQNVKVNRVMLPSMFIVTLCYLPNYAFLSIVIAGLELDYETQTWLIHVNYLWKLVYALAHAVISFKYNPHLRQRMGKVVPVWMNSKSRKSFLGPVNEQQAHFDILEEVWKVKAAKSIAASDVTLEATSEEPKLPRLPSLPKVQRVRKNWKNRDDISAMSKF